MADALRDILDMDVDELTAFLAELGQKPYRARQLLGWIYRKGVAEFSAMSDIAQPLREELARRACIGTAKVEAVDRADEGATAKYLFRLADGAAIEAVSMRDGEGRHTVCISSQVGCALGCLFCATGTLGFQRNLTCGEILFQALEIVRQEGTMGNVVFMGMGEPLLNVPNVVKAIGALADPTRLGLGTRKITVSTAGVVPGIEALAASNAPVRLALSLNSPFQGQREQLMPVSQRYPLPQVLEACDGYTARTGKPVLLEYVLLEGINTGHAEARELARIAKRLDSKVNLIEFNPIEGIPFHAPESRETLQFRDWLMKEGILATIRWRRGREISAGCGQLAAKKRTTDNGPRTTT